MAIIVDHHSSIVIVESNTCGLFLLSGYDETFPHIEWRGAVNPIGGNIKSGFDKSPKDILERELFEEINYPKEHALKPKLEGYADRSIIRDLRTGIYDNAKPYRDFLILDPIVERNKEKPEEGRKAIVSCYSSRIDKTLIELTKKNLEKGLKMNCEGVLNVVTVDELVNGKRTVAWAAPIILSHYLGTALPNPRNAFAAPIGEPRKTFEDYLNEFSYIKAL